MWLYENDSREEITGLPSIAAVGQGGLLDVLIDPDFATNGYIYYSYSSADGGAQGTTVDRARLSGTSLVDRETIFTMQPFIDSGRHFGSRLALDADGHLLITIGDRGQQDPAQDTSNHMGTTVRVKTDGGIPTDNPFVGDPTVPDEIYSYGHRNAQGMVVDPRDGTIWQHEHGPRGGDEVNIIRPSANYGWPVITYGEAYSGGQIGIGTEAPGMEQPEIYWTPSIAPSGMELYLGALIPEWYGDLFVGALAGTHLRRLSVVGGEIVEQEVLLDGRIGRVRHVSEGPDGALWLLTDAADGSIYRIVPE
jgi:glucose/arabinose dehydrogenase